MRGRSSTCFAHLRRGSWAETILLSRSVGVGEFYRVDERANTLMGPALTDAATWYERADWIGIHTTPYATIFLDALLQRERYKLEYALVDYQVPFKDKNRMRLKAVNWPKGLFLNHGKNREQARAAMLHLLAKA